MRTCPNGKCRKLHQDDVNQCPDCGAPMSREPDVVMDVNTHLYGLRANAGVPFYSGMGGVVRAGPEPFYDDTRKVMDTARDVVAELMGVPDAPDA